MSARLAGWIAVTLAFAVVLSLFVPWLVFLAIPIAVVVKILVARYGKGYQERDLAEMGVCVPGRPDHLRFGVETGVLAAATTLAAVAEVFGIEAAHWFDVAHVSVLDGEYVDVGTARAAVLDAVHPIILLVHLLFWLPWPVLGTVAGVRSRRHGAPSAPSSS